MLTDQFEKDGERDDKGNLIKSTGRPISKEEFMNIKNAIITSKIHNNYEKSKQNQQTKEAESVYTTAKGEKINFKSLFGKSIEIDDYRAGNQEIREKIIRPSDKFDRIIQLEEGEWASIENKYVQTGMFEFSVRGNGKIRSADDVAFIFRSLESQSIENAFAVYVNKDKHPFVQWISMGGISSTLVDQRLLIDAAIRFDANEMYFVHNHPSGNLSPSNADRLLFKKLKKAFDPFNIQVHGVIINLNSGKYSVFNEAPGILDARKTIEENQAQHRVPVFSFSKRAFLSSPFKTHQINNSGDVAEFLSQQRFTSGEKRGYLLLDTQHKIIGNFFATKKDINASLIEASILASRYCATSLIAYTNNVEQDVSFYNELQTKLKNLEINLLDAVQVERSQYVEETYSKYISLADEGSLMEPQYNNYENYSQAITNTMETIENHNGVPFANEEIEKLHAEQLITDAEKEKLLNENKTLDIHSGDIYSLKDYAGNYRVNSVREYANGLKVGENYKTDSGMGGSFTVKYLGVNENNMHLFENQHPYDGFYGKQYKVKPEDLNTFIISQSKTNTMEQKNLDYLANQMRYLGFGEDQKENLQKQMESGEQKFNLTVKQQYDGYPVNYTLHFNKSNESDMYFLNSYDAMMANGRQQSVYLDKGKGFTAKEAFNLMQDRAIFKELRNKNDGTTFDAWIKLSYPEEGKNVNDSRKMHIYNENYGYDLEKELAKHPIKELGNEGDKEKLIASLHKGNRQAVTFQTNGAEERKFIEANPKWKSLEIYNKDGKRMFIPHPKKDETAKQANKEARVQKVTPDEKKSAGIRR